ncbi:MAG: hypothetical protein HZA19_03040 [Nitrospirae bacterium]|nr:hypothetical protein [Nitrospirota bacterium]
MNKVNPTENWEAVEAAVKRGGRPYEHLSSGEQTSLLIETREADCVVELYPDGRLACQFGVDMEEMRNLLTGEQTEDMADDELVHVARYHLKPLLDRYRPVFLRAGFTEEVDANTDYYAVAFRINLDLSDPTAAVQQMERYLAILEKSSRPV